MTDSASPIAQKIAIYDMDKTITVRATYTHFLLCMAWWRAPWRLAFAPLLPLGLALYGMKIWGRKELKSFNQRLFIGTRQDGAALARHIDRFARLTLAQNAHPDALAQIARDRADGFTLVLATASYEFYAGAIARALDFDHVIATRISTDERGRLLARIEGDNCYDRAKLERIVSFLAGQGWSRESVYIRAYSDHVSDQHMLAYADEAVATTPHGKLRSLATERGWKIVDYR
ncbi:MAG: HAD-IB family phosphatase [Parasphingorhabdus sp.]|nr:HAD-IB family phosphatase [Parasphingorhabdus sp.]